VPKPSRPPHIAFPPTFELGLSSVEAAPGELIRATAGISSVRSTKVFRFDAEI
jgi:hypothetical protein